MSDRIFFGADGRQYLRISSSVAIPMATVAGGFVVPDIAPELENPESTLTQAIAAAIADPSSAIGQAVRAATGGGSSLAAAPVALLAPAGNHFASGLTATFINTWPTTLVSGKGTAQAWQADTYTSLDLLCAVKNEGFVGGRPTGALAVRWRFPETPEMLADLGALHFGNLTTDESDPSSFAPTNSIEVAAVPDGSVLGGPAGPAWYFQPAGDGPEDVVFQAGMFSLSAWNTTVINWDGTGVWIVDESGPLAKQAIPTFAGGPDSRLDVLGPLAAALGAGNAAVVEAIATFDGPLATADRSTLHDLPAWTWNTLGGQ